MFGSGPSFPPQPLAPLVEEVAGLLSARHETVSVAETVRISFCYIVPLDAAPCLRFDSTPLSYKLSSYPMPQACGHVGRLSSVLSVRYFARRRMGMAVCI